MQIQYCHSSNIDLNLFGLALMGGAHLKMNGGLTQNTS